MRKTIEHMDIDDLKKQWNAMDVPDAGVRDMEREVTSRGGNVVTLRDRLMRISRRRMLVCVAGALCLLPIAHDHTAMMVSGMLFFAVMGVMHFLQLRSLRALDLSASTVREALEGVLRIETLRTTRRVAGVIMAIPLIIYIVFTLTSNYGGLMLPACVAGVLAGCVVAYYVNRRATRLLLEIKRELSGGDGC